MKKYLISILIGFALAFSFGGIKGEKMQKLQEGIVMAEQYVAEESYLSSISMISGNLTINSFFSFDTFYLKMCEIPTSIAISARGSHLPKVLRFSSTIRILSSLDTPILEKNSKDEYLHYNFLKTSYRYYIYTLRRLLI